MPSLYPANTGNAVNLLHLKGVVDNIDATWIDKQIKLGYQQISTNCYCKHGFPLVLDGGQDCARRPDGSKKACYFYDPAKHKYYWLDDLGGDVTKGDGNHCKYCGVGKSGKQDPRTVIQMITGATTQLQANTDCYCKNGYNRLIRTQTGVDCGQSTDPVCYTGLLAEYENVILGKTVNSTGVCSDCPNSSAEQYNRPSYSLYMGTASDAYHDYFAYKVNDACYCRSTHNKVVNNVCTQPPAGQEKSCYSYNPANRDYHFIPGACGTATTCITCNTDLTGYVTRTGEGDQEAIFPFEEGTIPYTHKVADGQYCRRPYNGVDAQGRCVIDNLVSTNHSCYWYKPDTKYNTATNWIVTPTGGCEPAAFMIRDTSDVSVAFPITNATHLFYATSYPVVVNNAISNVWLNDRVAMIIFNKWWENEGSIRYVSDRSRWPLLAKQIILYDGALDNSQNIIIVHEDITFRHTGAQAWSTMVVQNIALNPQTATALGIPTVEHSDWIYFFSETNYRGLTEAYRPDPNGSSIHTNDREFLFLGLRRPEWQSMLKPPNTGDFWFSHLPDDDAGVLLAANRYVTSTSIPDIPLLMWPMFNNTRVRMLSTNNTRWIRV